VKHSTRLLHAGLPEPEQGAPFLPGPTFAAPFHLKGDPASSEFVYGRYGNPTWARYEQALGELDGGEAVLFASGMATASAVLMSMLKPGDTLVLPSDCYMSVRGVAHEHLAEWGVRVTAIPTAAMGPDELPDRLALLWIETPSNPGLDLADIAELSQAAHERGAIVAVDNTFATPLGQRPLELGADICVVSATKHLSGHSDLLLGYASARDPQHAETLRHWRTETGAIAGPFEAWLAHRSLLTLDVRLERGCQNAAALATALAGRDDVEGLRYPGLQNDPAHELAIRQMSRFGTILSFDLGGEQRAEAFLETAELVTQSTSFGGVHTTAERRGRWGRDEVPSGFIRLSAGCEDTEDLVEDVLSALDTT
jgi:cystathionine gamma-lyase